MKSETIQVPPVLSREYFMQTTAIWDRIGLSLSGLCALHCILTPILMVGLFFSPVLSIVHGIAHPFFAITIGITIILSTRKSHLGYTYAIALWTGFAAIITGWVAGHFWLGMQFEVALTLFGSGILLTAHWFNLRLKKIIMQEYES